MVKEMPVGVMVAALVPVRTVTLAASSTPLTQPILIFF
jgi:hypothetical protein